MMEGESQVATLMEREQELQQEVARVAQNGKVARHEVQTMRDGLETLQAKGSAMPAKVQEQKQVLETERSQLEEATRGARPGPPAARAPPDGPTSPSRAPRPDGCTRCARAQSATRWSGSSRTSCSSTPTRSISTRSGWDSSWRTAVRPSAPRSPPVQHLCLTAAAGQGTGCA